MNDELDDEKNNSPEDKNLLINNLLRPILLENISANRSSSESLTRATAETINANIES
jgi:hypothetical protein